MKQRSFVYQSYTDDFVVSKNQEFTLPSDYVWMHENGFYRFCSSLLYGLAKVIGAVCCRLVFHLEIHNREILKPYMAEGFFLYGNHTQPQGDVVMPALAVKPKRIYTVISPANFGIPVIGRLLPMLGAIPVPDNPLQMRNHIGTVKRRVDEGSCIVIFPEAHVWPYCTFIRPFPDTAFFYPAESGRPVFSLTTVYRKRRHGARPAVSLYLDGPFLPDMALSRKERQRKLKEEVSAAMAGRSALNNTEYVSYIKGGKE